MKRKLIFLNLVLVAATAWAVVQFQHQWQSAKARETAVLRQKQKPAPAPPYTPLPQVAPVVPAGYRDIADKDLFDKSRNPVVETVVTPPPPPKPIPPMPILHGIMNLDGVMAVFSEKENGPQKDVRVGEMIGEFKLASVNSQEVVFEWDGKKIARRVDELQKRKVTDNNPAPAAVASAAAPQPPPPAATTGPLGPGKDIGAGLHACQPGDSSAPGTVVDGLKKVVSATPWGDACRWEQVK